MRRLLVTKTRVELVERGPRTSPGFAAEEPGGWIDSTMASLVDEGDQCMMVGQLCPLTAFTVLIEVQGTPFEAVVDTGAEVRRPVTMMQAGDGARLKGGLAGQFNVKADRALIRRTCI